MPSSKQLHLCKASEDNKVVQLLNPCISLIDTHPYSNFKHLSTQRTEYPFLNVLQKLKDVCEEASPISSEKKQREQRNLPD
ncbi:hypothetical protein Y1Q_0010778 [Alligator mississippiensis]|uniref:Uncharacterized protein n=1 Tax=Alligator mississippiensis TaxID=8496 RepID=A0A151M6R2_ALLMI|nr:hypothetical protein Y1Q_0010778 [Alligator mississippiensis]